MTNNKLDFATNPQRFPEPHWWSAQQKEDRLRGHYFWTTDENWCYGPFAYADQASAAATSYEADGTIPDFDEGNSRAE